jgi:hypothetical protein
MAYLDNVALCPNPKCGYNKKVPWDAKGCPLCGSELMLSCPHCLHTIEDAGIFCMFCLKQMKTQLKIKRASQAGQAPSSGNPKGKTRLHEGQETE